MNQKNILKGYVNREISWIFTHYCYIGVKGQLFWRLETTIWDLYSLGSMGQPHGHMDGGVPRRRRFFFFFVFLLSLLQKKNNGLTNISVFITTARCRVARGGARTCECDKQEGAHPHQKSFKLFLSLLQSNSVHPWAGLAYIPWNSAIQTILKDNLSNN